MVGDRPDELPDRELIRGRSWQTSRRGRIRGHVGWSHNLFRRIFNLFDRMLQIRMAEHLGIDAASEQHLLWIAGIVYVSTLLLQKKIFITFFSIVVASLNAPLPSPWSMHADAEGQM
jgi:hypothetical protein